MVSPRIILQMSSPRSPMGTSLSLSSTTLNSMTPGTGLPKEPMGPEPMGLYAKPPSTEPYHSRILTLNRFSKASQMGVGVPALMTTCTGLSASPGFSGSL